MLINVITNLVIILGTCHGGCVPQNQDSIFNVQEEEKKNTRPNIFMDSDRITGGVSKPNEHVVTHHVDFSYGSGGNGPSSWYKVFPKCAGPKQSPINIPLSRLMNVYEKPLMWNGVYQDIPLSMSVTNNGHTVVLNTVFKNGSDPPKIYGGPLTHPYSLASVHFHWGSSGHQGSEHTIDGKSYPMEMHAVHYRSDLTFEHASTTPKGLAVLGYIFQIESPCTNAFDNIIDHMGMLKMEQDVPMPLTNMFRLSSLVDMFTTDFVTYDGSLTTPPCHESVVWIISPYTNSISTKQITAFRSLYASNPNIKNNFRPVQPLNGRNVTYIIAK